MQRDDQQHRQWIVEHAEQVLRSAGIAPGHIVLDVGCGNGAFAIPAANLVGQQGWVYAVDCDPQQLRKLIDATAGTAQENVVAIQTSQDALLPVGNATCDAVLLYDVLHLIDDWQTLFTEVYRVLKQGGIASIYPMHVSIERVREQCQAASPVIEYGNKGLLNFRKAD